MEPTPPFAPVFAGIRLTPSLLFRLGLLLLIALYLRTLHFDFVYDDLLIPLNPLNLSWHGVLDTFRGDIFAEGGQAASSYYRPLSGAIGIVVARLTFGTPAWFHLAALLIQVALYIACYRFSLLIFECQWRAALTTLLFILHPSKVETIAWIGSSFCDGQAAIYFFLVLICYFKWFETRKPVWMLASVAFFAGAIFTKETMVLLPLLLAVHCWLRSERSTRLRATAFLMVSFAIVAAGYALARHSALKPLVASSIAITPTFTIVNLWTAPHAFLWYLEHLAFPFPCAILYDFTTVFRPDPWLFVAPALVVLALVALLIVTWRKTRSWQLLFFAAWFLLTIAPVVAMAPSVTVHDRYLQLPSYPFCALIAWALYWLWLRRPQLRWTSAALAGILVVGWSVGTWAESGFWRDSMSLWTRAVHVAPHSVNARIELARLYIRQQPPNLDRSLQILDDGLRLLPDSPGLWRTRGLYLFNAGDLDHARLSLLRSLEAANRYAAQHSGPEPSDVQFGRASADFFLGEIEMEKGNSIAADDWLRRALAIDPDNLDYQQVMVTNLRRMGRTEEAEQHEQIARQIAARTAMKLAH